MSSWAIILIVFTLVLYLLPLVPGIIELIRPTDNKPLRVMQDYDSNPLHFATGFRNYVGKNFTDMNTEKNYIGTLPDNTKYQLVGETGTPTLDTQNGSQNGRISKLILSAFPLSLPAGEIFEQEVYGRQSITTGERSQFRAVMSDHTLNIREHGTVLRWAHSESDMIVGKHSKLFGRATSKQSIILGDNVHFERLNAPIILTPARTTLQQEPPAPALTLLDELDDVKVHSGRRWVLNGHLEFPANHSFDGDIVTGTTGRFGDWAHIRGSIKCNAHDDVVHHLHTTGVATRHQQRPIALCEIGNHVRIDGSLVSSYDLTIGQNCKIFGPVIAEHILIIGAGTVIGSPEHPTTVTAPHIVIENGCVVYGTLWATESGIVRTATAQPAGGVSV